MGDRLATIDMGRKWWAAVPRFRGELVSIYSVAWAEAYLRTKWHLDAFNRLATIHRRQEQTDRTERNRFTNGRSKTDTTLKSRVILQVNIRSNFII